jgi:hypothetical protein
MDFSGDGVASNAKFLRRLDAAAIGELPLNWPAGLVGP